jgi:hypothetical protein
MIDDEFKNHESSEEHDGVQDAQNFHREDKIFNNRYNVGEALVEGEEQVYSNRISVASDYADSYLKDLYDYESNLESKAIIDELFSFIRRDHELSILLQRSEEKNSTSKIKFSRDEINFFFGRINDRFEVNLEASIFYSPIYILEILSSISSIEYRKLFDMLETDYQEILLIELNKKYRFLDGKLNKKRIH